MSRCADSISFILALAAACLLFGVLGPKAEAASTAAEEFRNLNAWFLFAPQGFDDNDTAELVIDGYLPNDCHRVADPLVEIDQAKRVITVQPRARYFDFGCDQFMVPFSKVVELGILAAGNWVVKSPGLDDTNLFVAEATTAGPDDHVYAPLEAVTVAVRPDLQKIIVTLAGRFTNSCTMWETIRIIDSGDSIQLLPITRAQNRPDCRNKVSSFDDVKVTIPWRGPGRYLLHSRSLNGQAINTMFTVYGEGR